MERSDFILMCQKASFKMDYSGAWWMAKWNPDELVVYKNQKTTSIGGTLTSC